MIVLKTAVKAYEGLPGKCMCGCSGKTYTEAAKVLEIASEIEWAKVEMPAAKFEAMKASLSLVEREDYTMLETPKKLLAVYYEI
jgi:hypothetical protein